MNYQVFARKYRPQDFDSVVGQEHITRTLKNAIQQNRLAHAYLFVGPRGVGKTSTARILAKALNCVKAPTVNPCGECDACREIAQGISLDVLEIDGASNNGVEQVRELRENVRFAPTRGKFKIYIIDEVHMLTSAAFNALLKTLEEPPPHVKFIFATTEPQKVLATILSRCQRFDLRRIPAAAIVKHLQFIAGKELITLDEGAAVSIARGAEGGLGTRSRCSTSLWPSVERRSWRTMCFLCSDSPRSTRSPCSASIYWQEIVRGRSAWCTTREKQERIYPD